MSYAAEVAARRGAPPPFLDKRFDAAGRALPDPGNTMIGHVRPGPVLDALVAARDRLAASPAGDGFAWLPPSSYHMTIYDGLLYGRRAPEFWPAGLDPEATAAEAEAFVFPRLAALRPEGAPAPFRLAPVALEPARGAAGVWVRLEGADPAEERRLRGFRDACADALGLRARPGHDAYAFHITMAYGIAWPDDEAARAFDAALAEADAAFRAAASVIEIGPPELCRFADMTRFEVVTRLD